MFNKPPSYDAAISRLTATGHFSQGWIEPSNPAEIQAERRSFDCRERWGSEVLIKPRGTFHLYHEEYTVALQAREAMCLAKAELRGIAEELRTLEWPLRPSITPTPWTAFLKPSNKVVHIPPAITSPFNLAPTPTPSASRPSSSTFSTKISSFFGTHRKDSFASGSKQLRLGDGVGDGSWKVFEGYGAEKEGHGDKGKGLAGKKTQAASEKEGLSRMISPGETAEQGPGSTKTAEESQEQLPSYPSAAAKPVKTEGPLPTYPTSVLTPIPAFTPQMQHRDGLNEMSSGLARAENRVEDLTGRRKNLLDEIEVAEKVVSRCTITKENLENAWTRLEKGYALMGMVMAPDGETDLLLSDLKQAQEELTSHTRPEPFIDIKIHLSAIDDLLRREFRELTKLLDDSTDSELLDSRLEDCQYGLPPGREKLTEKEKVDVLRAALAIELLAVEQAKAARVTASALQPSPNGGGGLRALRDYLNDLKGNLTLAKDAAEIWFNVADPVEGKQRKVIQIVNRLSTSREKVRSMTAVADDLIQGNSLGRILAEMKLWDLRLLYEEARWESSAVAGAAVMESSRSALDGGGLGRSPHEVGMNFSPFDSNKTVPPQIAKSNVEPASEAGGGDDTLPSYAGTSIMNRGRPKKAKRSYTSKVFEGETTVAPADS